MQLLQIVNAPFTEVTVAAGSSSGLLTISVDTVSGASGYLFFVSHSVPYSVWCLSSGNGNHIIKGYIYNPSAITRTGKVFASAVAYKLI